MGEIEGVCVVCGSDNVVSDRPKFCFRCLVERLPSHVRVHGYDNSASKIPSDLFDPRPLNRQVLEASGGKKMRPCEVRDVSEAYEFSGGTWIVGRYFNGFSVGRTGENLDVILRTIGDFRRFCSLPGIEIEVVVPEDYKPC